MQLTKIFRDSVELIRSMWGFLGNFICWAAETIDLKYHWHNSCDHPNDIRKIFPMNREKNKIKIGLWKIQKWNDWVLLAKWLVYLHLMVVTIFYVYQERESEGEERGERDFQGNDLIAISSSHLQSLILLLPMAPTTPWTYDLWVYIMEKNSFSRCLEVNPQSKQIPHQIYSHTYGPLCLNFKILQSWHMTYA